MDCFHEVSIEEYPQDTEFDFVFAFEVLEHLRDPVEVIQKIGRLLKPGGTFCGTSPYPFRKNVVIDPTHRYVLHPASWQNLFNFCGFEDTRTYPVSILPFVWRISKVHNPLFHTYLPGRYIIATTLIVARGYTGLEGIPQAYDPGLLTRMSSKLRSIGK